jgi:hypothetical protein
VQSAIEEDVDAIPYVAWKLLLLAAALTEEIGQRGRNEWLSRGGAVRVSLSHWANFVRERLGDGDTDVCRQVVETYLVSQHLRVATIRREEGKLKLRLALEDEGLVSLLPPGKSDWHPVVTGDRLDPALVLLAYCKVCNYDREEGRYTAR